MVKQKNRWAIFIGAWIITFFNASSAIFSVFSKPMTELNGWTMTDFTLSFSIFQLCLGITGILAGRIVDKKGAKPLMYVGGTLFGLGWFLAGACTTITTLYLTFGIMAGVGCGLLYNAAIATALRWFPDKRGVISGCLLGAAAFGPFTLAPFTHFILSRFGTDYSGIEMTFRVLGIIFFVAIAAVGWLLDSAPADYKPEGWKAPEGTNRKAIVSNDVDWKKMLTSSTFYILFFIFICASTAGNMMISSTSVIAQTQIGLTAAIGAMAVSVSTISNFTGRLSFGVIYDKLGDFKALLLSLTFTTIALLVLGSTQSAVVFFICVAVLGFSFGGPLVVFPPITSKMFGTKNLGLNYGIMFLGYSCGALVGPRIAAVFKDSTGVFTGAYFTAAALAAVGAMVTLLMVIKEKKAKGE